LRFDLEPLGRRDATRLAAAAPDEPQVAGVFEGDLIAAHRGMAQ
jgi:hypothetical protein